MFVGDHPALDFLNTVASPAGAPIDWLEDGPDLLDWLKRAGVIDEAVVARFRAHRALDAVAAQARELRDWFRSFVKRHAGKSYGAGAPRELERLNRLLAEDEVYRQVVPAAKGLKTAPASSPFQWSQQRRWTDPQRLLQPIAEAMGDLVCHADFRLIRTCEGEACTLMFYDRTKGHGRRWCSMSACGNRAKAAAHRARLRAAEQAKR